MGLLNAPFTTEQFLANFEHYNRAIWPAQVAAYVVGMAVVAMTLRPARMTGRLVSGALAMFWIWTGVVYFIVLPLGGLSAPTAVFGGVFILQSLVWLATGVLRRGLSFRVHAGVLPSIGGLFVLYAMVIYPALGVLSGHTYPRMPMFGVTPCPVVIFTFGLLLWTEGHVPKYVLVIPFLWSLLGLSAALSFGMLEDWGLLAAGLLGTALVIWRDRAPLRTYDVSTRATAQ